MASIIAGYEYDIFISYRQKDNKGERWVSEFVEALKTELESTFKEEISVYFDINPHDGLLETYDVDASLKDKLKCLVFMPIISRTYCDPKSFAWEHEFKAFIEQASQDQFGLKVKLPNGNVANRMIPIQIHDLHPEDKSLIEKELGGVLRAIEFIYKEPGVNRPITARDSEERNSNKTNYRNQINKVANAIDEVIHKLKGVQTSAEQIKPIHEQPFPHIKEDNKTTEQPGKVIFTQRSKKWMVILLSVVVCIIFAFAIYTIIQKSKKVNEIGQLEKSLAVLPFKLLSDEPDKQYLADGMMDEITLHLSKVKDLRVLGRTSTEQYRNPTKTTTAIGKELDVNYLLEGSFQKFGDSVRLIVQLIKTGKEGHVWANNYDRLWKNIFSVQSEVAQKIARELNAEITPEEKQLIVMMPTKNLTAYDFYQRGNEELWKYYLEGNYHSLNLAEEFFSKALQFDTTFARAYAGLAGVFFGKHQNESKSYFSSNYLDSLLLLSERAISYDNNLSEGYLFRAFYFSRVGKTEQAINDFDKSIRYNPNNWQAYLAEGYNIYIDDLNHMDFVKGLDYIHKAAELNHGGGLVGIFYSLAYVYTYWAGFPEEGKKYYEEAFKLSGDTVNYLGNIGSLEIQYGDFEKGIEKSLKAYAKDSAEWRLANQYLAHGEYNESLKYFTKYTARLKSSGQIPIGNQGQVGYLYWLNGDKEKAEYWFNEQKRLSNESIKMGRTYSNSIWSGNAFYDLAAVYAFKGEKEKVYELLRSLDQHLIFPLCVVDDIKIYNPLFNSIRSDSEFQKFVKSWEAKYQTEHDRVRKWLEVKGEL